MPRNGSIAIFTSCLMGAICSFDDHATQRLDRAGRAYAAVTDEGDGLALPFLPRAALPPMFDALEHNVLRFELAVTFLEAHSPVNPGRT
jgi:hypothetical protein